MASQAAPTSGDDETYAPQAPPLSDEERGLNPTLHCWTRNFAQRDPSSRVHRPSKPPPLDIIGLLPIAARVGSYVSSERRAGREPIFDLSGIDLHPPDPGPVAGVPLGGIGAGCIGRGWRGDFNRWSIWPGRYQKRVVVEDQFSIRVQGQSTGTHAQVLSVNTPRALGRNGAGGSAMRTWEWGMDGQKGTYYGLFPRAWTHYDQPVPGVDVMCKQISPVVPHNYEASSLPCSAFVWTITNTTSENLDVSLMFTFRNGDGAKEDTQGGHRNLPFAQDLGNGLAASGIALEHTHRAPVVFDVEDDGTPASCCSCGGSNARKKHKSDQDATWDEKEAVNGEGAPLGHTFHDKTTFAISAVQNANINVSKVCNMDSNGKYDRGQSGRRVWECFSKNGSLQEAEKEEADQSSPSLDASTRTSRNGVALTASLCQNTTNLAPGESIEMVFTLVWDSPMARFGTGKALPRRYTRYFGRNGDAAQSMSAYSLQNHRAWEKEINAWQSEVLNDSALPSFYKCLLFNELYYVVDGGTIWTDSARGELLPMEGPPTGAPQLKTMAKVGDSNVVETLHGEQTNVGQFLYLEGHEYYMYNTYDVHFYASFALTHLWPELQLSLQRDFAKAVMEEDDTIRKLLGDGRRRPRKVRGAVPHDLGSPSEEPWTKVNVYNFQDVSRWKDLGPKFTLTILRDYRATQSKPFILSMFPTVLHVMETAEQYDRDGDGLIENQGFPDQTYDIWSVSGPSAYTGGLWVAALAATVKMAELVLETLQQGDGVALPEGTDPAALSEDAQNASSKYSAMYERARDAYYARLWNGKYFKYDDSGSRHADSIMSDQLAGNWYARACGLPPIVPPGDAYSALSVVYDFNVDQFAAGRAGAVNGMRPNGRIDNSSMQSREVWTGVTYAVAAAMLQEWGASAATHLDDGVPVVVESAEQAQQEGSGSVTSRDSLASNDPRQSLWHAAFRTAHGMWISGWNEFGYWYATPEGWEHTGNYRSLGYMRPLSVWAMQWAIEHANLPHVFRSISSSAMGEKAPLEQVMTGDSRTE